LRTPFLAALPAAAREAFAAIAGLDAELDAMLERGRRRWPEVALPGEVFVPFVAARVPLEGEPAAALTALHGEDLYLACACAQGNGAAARCFVRELGPKVKSALSQVAQGALADEIVQQVLTRVLTGEGEPAIVKYAGRGKLSAWVQVMAIREARDAHRRRKRSPIDEMNELVERAVVVDDDPLLARLKSTYREAFKRAFAAAFAALSNRERAVLRYHYLDDLGIDRIGELYGVHRATVARWRVGAREALFEHTRKILRADLKLRGDELDSVLHLIESQLSVSFERLAAADSPEPAGDEPLSRSGGDR
jgi:RNA polymerase sigma-70 factor (ECF subfamily)